MWERLGRRTLGPRRQELPRHRYALAVVSVVVLVASVALVIWVIWLG